MTNTAISPRLAEIKRRLEAATQGEWKIDYECFDNKADAELVENAKSDIIWQSEYINELKLENIELENKLEELKDELESTLTSDDIDKFNELLADDCTIELASANDWDGYPKYYVNLKWEPEDSPNKYINSSSYCIVEALKDIFKTYSDNIDPLIKARKNLIAKIKTLSIKDIECIENMEEVKEILDAEKTDECIYGDEF